MKRFFCVMIVVVFFLGAIDLTICSAGEEEIRAEIAELKARIAALETRLAEQKPKTAAYKEEIKEIKRGGCIVPVSEGINISAGATFIAQSAIDANNVDTFSGSSKKKGVTDASYSIDLEFEKEFDDWGRAFVHLETGDGAGVEDELEVFSNVNRDADDQDNSVIVTQALYEHYFNDKQITLSLGRIDPTWYVDQNEVANCECTQFLGRIFRNAPTIDFPDNTTCLHAVFVPEGISWLELEAQVADGDNDWEDIADDIFTSCQINLKPQLGGRSGNYRIYGWFKNTEYTKWSDASKSTEDKTGFGTSIDQQITDLLTLFGRYGWADPDVYDPNITSSSGAKYSLEHTWSTGFQLKGNPWGRENDHLSAAIGMALPSDEYKKAGSNLKAKDEGHIEIYYSWVLNEHFTLSPDLQIIWNPFGSDYVVNDVRRDDILTILGCRGQVDF